MTTSRVDVTTEPDGTLVIRPRGQVDVVGTAELRRTLVEAIRHTRPRRLVVNLADVEDLDPINLGAVAAACHLGDDQRVVVFLDHCSTTLAEQLAAAGVARHRLRHVRSVPAARYGDDSVLEAREVAEALLGGLPDRWRHTAGVAARAGRLAGTLPGADAEALVAAAWLHDIGSAEALYDTGFPPLDGGRHLRSLGWPVRIAGLVAHQSEAWCVAEARGLAGQLGEFPRERGAVADALTYADQTVGPDGQVMDVEERLADMLRRDGPDSPDARAHSRRAPLLRAAVERVERRRAS